MDRPVEGSSAHDDPSGWGALQAAVIDALPLAVYRVDLAGVVRAWNRAAEATFGWPTEQSIGRPLAELVGDDPTAVAERLRAVASGETIRGAEIVRSRRDGSLFPSRLFAAPVRDADGQIVGALGLVEDDSQRRAALEALERSEGRFRSLFEDNPAAMLLVDPATGRVVDANPAAARYYGWTRDELGALDLGQLVAESDERLAREIELARAQQRHHVEVRHRQADGQVREVEVFSSQVEVDDVPLLLSLVVDVDDRRRAERALLHSHELMRHIIEHDPNAIAVHDRDLRYIYVSQRYLDDYGVAERDIIGRHHYEVFPDIPEEWREIHRRALAGEVSRSDESRFERSDGTVDWTRWECRPWYDEDDQVGGIILYTEVITPQKQLEERLRHAQKMELVGQLAGGIAHDYRNVLQVVLSQAELALDEAGPDDPLTEYLEAIRDATERSIGLTRQLMTLARRQSIAPVRIDVASAVGESHDLLQRLLGRRIRLVHEPAPGRHDVLVDPSQFDQVLVNLCVNARDAINDRDARSGTITVRVRTERIDAVDTRHGPAALDGDFVVMEVTDDGCGMDAETRSHLFEPFFTTKTNDRGTGLGLATVYGIVGRHGGFLHVMSEPGEGSTFRVYLPHRPADVREPDPVGPARRG